MKKNGKSLLTIFLMLICIVMCSLNCMAKAPECALTVVVEDSKKQAINGLDVNICKIADINGTDYYPAASFENSGISIAGIVNDPSATNAKKILSFVMDNNVPSLSAVSVSGKAEFKGLRSGIWLVYCNEKEEYTFNPYIVFLPFSKDGKLYYEISSTPKTKVNTPNDKSIYVIKKWEDKNNIAKKRPDDIIIELKTGKAVVDTAILNESNGWAYTFTGLSDDAKYEVAEKAVKDYSVKYSGDSENGFIVTNTYNGEKLPQTGQLWWPIAIIFVVGVLFVVLGIVELGVRKNGKKNK